jgi:LPS export ABC transporter protein LptC
MNKQRILLFVAMALTLVACSKQPQQKNDESASSLPEQALERFSVTETREGNRHWTLDASAAQIMEEQKKVFMQSPRVKFFENGEQTSTLIAERGRIDLTTYDVWGEGKCIVTTSRGDRLETSDLHYRSDVQKIVTDAPVKLERERETVEGIGFEATPDLETITIRKQKVTLK